MLLLYLYLIYPIFYVWVLSSLLWVLAHVIYLDYVLSITFIMFFDYLFIVTGIVISKDYISSKLIIICLIISNLLTIIPFHYFWLKNVTATIKISAITLAIDVYIIITYKVAFEKFPKTVLFALVVFNYGIFFIAITSPGIPFWIYLYCDN